MSIHMHEMQILTSLTLRATLSVHFKQNSNVIKDHAYSDPCSFSYDGPQMVFEIATCRWKLWLYTEPYDYE